MKKFLRSLIAIVACSALAVSCSDSDSGSGNDLNPTANYWSFNGANKVGAGSVLIYQVSDHVTVLFASKSGLTTAMEFDQADDRSEITLPVSAIGSTIDLTKLTAGDGVSFTSRLSEFGDAYDFNLNAGNLSVSSGTLTTTLEDDKMKVVCEFTTRNNGTKFSVNLEAPFKADENPTIEGSLLEYTVDSKGISESNEIRSAFYYKNTWNDGWTFTYSVSTAEHYIQLGSNAYLEIYVGAEQLLNGEPFNIATTPYPFSFRIDYLDIQNGILVPVTVDNNNRKGASGYITFKKNSQGLYDTHFNLSLNSGDLKVSGYYSGEMHPRNLVYSTVQGDIATLRSATLDLSGDPVVLYLSTKTGTAGPNQFDIKGEVSRSEWRYGKFMAFSGQGSSLTWIDGVTYNYGNIATLLGENSGGNWRVMQPTPLPGGVYVAECQTMLFGPGRYYGYFYGELKVIQ